MTKSIKHILLLCCSAALLVCGALFAACDEEKKLPEEVSVSGQIVFEGDEYDEYSRDVTLAFKPNGADVQGAAAALSYTDEEGNTTSETFALSRGEDGYSLTDESGKSYALDLAWGCANPEDDFAVVHGEFIVTDTFEDYETHEEGSRHFIEEGYFGAGGLDVSGMLWYYNLEDMRGMNGSYLRFYIAPNDTLDREWDRTSARGTTWIDRAEDDGNEYLIYYYFVTENGVRKLLVYDVQLFDANAETLDFAHYFGDFFFKNGKRLYVSDLIDAGEVGDEVMTLFLEDGFEWGDGTLHPKIHPCYGMTYGSDGKTDWMRYCFSLPGEDDPSTEEFYFELDEEGNILLQTAEMGCHVWYQNREKTWGYDAFYIAPSPTEIVFTMLFGLGRVGADGETDYFEDPLIVKRADGEFTVYAEGEAWDVSLGVDQEAWRITCNIEEAEEVAVKGKIVFDEDSEREDHDFDEEITLRFTPVDGSADGAPATLIYQDGTDKPAVKGGFTLAAEGKSGYILRDEAGHEYAVELQWTPEGKENSVAIHGEFIADEKINDYEGAMNTAYHGYFGLDGVQVSHEMWWINFGEVPRTQTKCLNVYNATILDTPQYIDPVYGEFYCGYNFIPGDGGYGFGLYLTEKNGKRCLLIRQIDYLPETLTWTTNPVEVDNGYAEGGGSVAITKSTLLYSAKLFGLEKGMVRYAPYDYEDPHHASIRQYDLTVWKGENGEHDGLFWKDAECAFLFHVNLDENGEIVEVYDGCAGFVFDFTPDLSTDFQYAFGAFLMSNAEDIYTPKEIYDFGYLKGGTICYPANTQIVKNADHTFTVRELDGNGQTLNEWTVSFTDLNAEVPVPHVAEVSSPREAPLSFNRAHETGASEKGNVFFAPSAVHSAPSVYKGDFVDAGACHYSDYQFFYKNLEEDVRTRIAAYKTAQN